MWAKTERQASLDKPALRAVVGHQETAVTVHRRELHLDTERPNENFQQSRITFRMLAERSSPFYFRENSISTCFSLLYFFYVISSSATLFISPYRPLVLSALPTTTD